MSKPNIRLYPNIFNPRWFPLSLMRKNFEIIIRNFIHSKKFSKLIDYGCGDMPYKVLFAPKVEKYYGLDLKENPLADLHIKPNGKIDIEDNSVDLVLSTQVLEHVEDPIEYLSESYRILKHNGLLIICTHGYWIFHPHPNDYWRWTSSGLKKIIEERGFNIKYFKGIVSRPAVGFLLLQDSLIFKVPQFLVPLVAFPFQIAMLIIDKILASQKSRNKDASIYIAVCETVKTK